jgi:hypothetical protein
MCGEPPLEVDEEQELQLRMQRKKKRVVGKYKPSRHSG